MTTELILPLGETQFVDENGNPYALGNVYHYIPSTMTPKTTYSDAAGASPNSQPVALDAAGRASIYGLGQYRQILFDVNGVQIWDKVTGTPSSATTSSWSNITADPNPAVTGADYLCNTTGGAFTVTLPASPTVGDNVGFDDAAGTWGTSALTVGANTKPIMGVVDNMICTRSGLSFRLVYQGATNGWRIAQL